MPRKKSAATSGSARTKTDLSQHQKPSASSLAETRMSPSGLLHKRRGRLNKNTQAKCHMDPLLRVPAFEPAETTTTPASNSALSRPVRSSRKTRATIAVDTTSQLPASDPVETSGDSQPSLSMSPLDQILWLSRTYKHYQQAEQRLGNQIFAINRIGQRGDQTLKGTHVVGVAAADAEGADPAERDIHPEPVGPFSILTLNLRDLQKQAERLKNAVKRDLEKLAKQLPVYAWIDCPERRGIGALSLALLVGAIGDLSNYSNPAKVWTRMGVGLRDGERQRRVAGRDKESIAKAIRMGYSPTRRALMHVVGECLIKQNGADGPYKTLYNTRKVYEAEKAPELPKIAHHKRAMRYMEKRLLKDLWQAWRASTIAISDSPLPAASATTNGSALMANSPVVTSMRSPDGPVHQTVQ